MTDSIGKNSNAGHQESKSGQDPLASSGLTSTTHAFTQRIAKQKQAQLSASAKAEAAAKERHNVLLGSMLNIRRSLTDVARIDLGERFSFALIADDWQGWPRITVRLHDNMLPNAAYPQLQITAHDRQEQAMVEIKYETMLVPEQISLVDEPNIRRLPQVLKKTVRSYLDMVGEIILCAENETIEVHDHSNLIQRPVAAPSQQENFFDDEMNDLLESLPEMEDVDGILLDDEF